MISGPTWLHGKQLLGESRHVPANSELSRELLDLHSLLRSAQGVTVKSSLMFGLAGSGKSLTMLKILSEWKSRHSETPFKQFNGVVYVTGPERTRLSAKDVDKLWQLHRLHNNNQEQQLIINYFKKHSDQLLF